MNKLVVSSSPHIRSKASTNRIMLDVVIALLPTTVMGCLIFGLRAQFAFLNVLIFRYIGLIACDFCHIDCRL